MDDKELLAMASEFDLGPEPLMNGRWEWWKKYPQDGKRFRVYVKNTGNPDDGPDRWAIIKEGRSTCLSKDGDWEYQPMPSSRSDDFYDRCRYASSEEAITYYRRWFAAIEKWATSQPPDAVLNYEDCTEDLEF